MTARNDSRSAFTITELLVVIAVIAVLLALLLPALGGVLGTGNMAKSMNSMRQIALWMNEYSSDNRDTIVPSRFNYSEHPYPGDVRKTANPPVGQRHSGAWTDILQTVFEIPLPQSSALPTDYRYDSPDKALYDVLGTDAFENPFRAAAPNTKTPPEAHGGVQPTPFGRGARGDNSEIGLPGFFAANDFFSAGWPLALDSGQWYTNGQIVTPHESLYLIDSFYGETIAANPKVAAFDARKLDESGGRILDSESTLQVDFRYAGENCLMLFLDGHVSSQSRWEAENLDHLGIRVLDLTTPLSAGGG